MPVVNQIKHPVPNARARAVAQGLIGTGRAVAMRSVGGFIHVRALTGPDYWVSHLGDALLRGDAPETAEEMQPGFLNAMARAGAKS